MSNTIARGHLSLQHYEQKQPFAMAVRHPLQWLGSLAWGGQKISFFQE
jgi:hypothetical protein